MYRDWLGNYARHLKNFFSIVCYNYGFSLWNQLMTPLKSEQYHGNLLHCCSIATYTLTKITSPL